MEQIEKRLLEMKEKSDELKTKKSRLEGEIEGLMGQLKTKFGFDSVKEAETAVEVNVEEISEKKRALEKQVDELEKAYDWSSV